MQHGDRPAHNSPVPPTLSSATGVLASVKRLLVGRPIATTDQEHQRLPKTIALATFSSDAISSTAYATEEILFVLAAGSLQPGARPQQARAHLDRRGRPAGDRRHVVPPDDLRLPERWWLLHREPGEPGRVPVARGGRLAPCRLHPDRRRLHLGRRRGHHLHPRVPRASPINGCCCVWCSSRS